MASIPLRTEEVLEQQKTAGNNFVCPIHRKPRGGCDGRTECEGPRPTMQLALPVAIAGTKLAQLIEEDQNRFVVPTTW
jgi:hypothetical protein